MKKYIYQLALAFLAAGTLASCQPKADFSKPQQPRVLLEELEDPCAPNSLLDFELSTRYVADPPAETQIAQGMSVGAGTSLEMLSQWDHTDCTCDIDTIVLEFDFLPANPNDLDLVDHTGQSIDFTYGSNPLTGYPWLIVDQDPYTTDIFVVMEDNLDPKPNLELAGGICMIDNISNPNGGPYDRPLRELDYDENGNVIGVSLFVPTKELAPSKLPLMPK